MSSSYKNEEEEEEEDWFAILERRISMQREELKEHRANIQSTIDRDVMSLQERVNQDREEMQDIYTRYRQAMDELAWLRGQLSESNNQIEEISSQLHVNELSLKQLQESSQRNENENSAHVAELQGRVWEKDIRLQQCANKAEELRENIKQLEAVGRVISGISHNFIEQDASNRRAENEVKDLKHLVNQTLSMKRQVEFLLHQQVEICKENLKESREIEVEMCQMTEKFREQMQEKDSVVSELAGLKIKCEKLELVQHENIQEQEKLKMEVTEERASSLKLKEQIKELQQFMSTFMQEKQQLQERIANLEKDLDIAQQQLLQSDTHIKELEREDEKMRQEMTQLEEKLTTLSETTTTSSTTVSSTSSSSSTTRERRELSNSLPAGGEVAQGVGVLVSFNSKETVKTLQTNIKEKERTIQQITIKLQATDAELGKVKSHWKEMQDKHSSLQMKLMEIERKRKEESDANKTKEDKTLRDLSDERSKVRAV